MFDVIVPVFKTHPDLVRKCLRSLQNQRFKDFEVWVVDGTPADHERYSAINSVYQDFADSEVAFHFIRQTGRGVSQARNQAIALGNRPYIAFLDSDDMWYSERLLWASMDLPERDTQEVLWWGCMDVTKTLQGFSGSEYSTQRLAGYLDPSDWKRFQTNWESGQDYFFAALRPIMTSACIIRRSRFEAIGGFDESLYFGEDTNLWMRLAGNPLTENSDDDLYRVSYEPDLIGYYHCHEEQTTAGGIQSVIGSTNNPNQILAEIQAQKQQQVLLHISPDEVAQLPGFLERYADSWKTNRDYWVWLLTTFRDSQVFDTSFFGRT
jgi:glycosyltransferase involved in cell wall biosynthesis